MEAKNDAQMLKELGNRVRAKRKILGLTQMVLAEKASFHWTYISMIERGKTNITLIKVKALAKALEMELDELIQGL